MKKLAKSDDFRAYAADQLDFYFGQPAGASACGSRAQCGLRGHICGVSSASDVKIFLTLHLLGYTVTIRPLHAEKHANGCG